MKQTGEFEYSSERAEKNTEIRKGEDMLKREKNSEEGDETKKN
jgi:hypothetical protein